MDLVLTMRHLLSVDPDTAFQLCTEPRHLVNWWGPEGVDCISAEVDLRIGGRYRLVNRLNDGSLLTISGEYQRIIRPKLLCFTWQVNRQSCETVKVKFIAFESQTEIIVIHEKIPCEADRESHRGGWLGCFSKLDSKYGQLTQLR